MKKVLLGLISIIFATQVSFAQPVSDMAVIPMGITIQSIMRLNITKGGNIEFVFSRIAQVAAGIGFDGAYETTAVIAASQNYDISLNTDGDFSDGTTNTLGLDVIGVQFTVVPTATSTLPTPINTAILLSALDGNNIITDGTLGASATHTFTIQWRCGTGAETSIAGNPAGRYTTNIVLSLVAH